MKVISSLSLVCASIAFAGGSQGGGTPPSIEDAGLLLMSSPMLDGILFEAGSDVSLLSRTELQPEMVVSGGSLGGGTPPLVLSESDITLLRDKTKRVEAVSAEGGNLSFDVLPGDTINTITLKDRRLIMRESVAR